MTRSPLTHPVGDFGQQRRRVHRAVGQRGRRGRGLRRVSRRVENDRGKRCGLDPIGDQTPVRIELAHAPDPCEHAFLDVRLARPVDPDSDFALAEHLVDDLDRGRREPADVDPRTRAAHCGIPRFERLEEFLHRVARFGQRLGIDSRRHQRHPERVHLARDIQVLQRLLLGLRSGPDDAYGDRERFHGQSSSQGFRNRNRGRRHPQS